MKQDEMVKTLKEKLTKINQAVNFYEEEKFNHLSQLEKKLLKKRMKMKNFKEKSVNHKRQAK